MNYLTGLMVLPNKSLANIARCILDSADKTNLPRFFSEAQGFQDQVNDRRLRYLPAQTPAVHRPATESARILDDTLCEHVGSSLFEYVDRHYNHGEDTYPLAHNVVTSHFSSGPVRFPVDLRHYRRYDELTQWPTFVQKHFPERLIPTKRKERTALHKQVDAQLLTDPVLLALHQQFRTKIDLALALLDTAVQRKLPFSRLLFDGWYLTEELVAAARRHKKNWISLLKKNCNLESASFTLKDAQGQPIALPGPHIAVQNLVPLISATAYRPSTVAGQTCWTFSRTVRIPGLGQVRLVISFQKADLTGTYTILVTNRLDWSALQIIAAYLRRWPIKTFYQDGKGLLGLDEYRMRNAEAIQNHWCLVFIAYSFLHLDCLPSSPTKGDLPTKTIGEAWRQRAQTLIQTLILHMHERLQEGEPPRPVWPVPWACAKPARCGATNSACGRTG